MPDDPQVEKLQNTIKEAEDLCDRLSQCLQIVECYVSILLMAENDGVVETEYLKRVKAHIQGMGQLTNRLMAKVHSASPADDLRQTNKSFICDIDVKLPSLSEIISKQQANAKESSE